MKIGIAAFGDVEATAERCRRLDVDRVYIDCPSLPGFQENGYPDPAGLRAFKGRLEARGIEAPAAHFWLARWPSRPPLREGATNPDALLRRDRRCLDAMLRTLELLKENGIASVLLHIDLGRPTDAGRAEACWEGLIALYRELIPAAERCGVGIGNHSLHRLLPDGLRERAMADGVRLEDYGRYTADGWGGPFLVGTWKELHRLVDAVPSPRNGVTLCTGMDIPGGDAPALVRAFAGKIHVCQFRDHSERWPAARLVSHGEGRVDFPAVVAALREVGYRGMIHLEGFGRPNYPGEDVEARSIAYVKSLLGEG